MGHTSLPRTAFSLPMDDLLIALPEPGRSYAQNEEWCVVEVDGCWRRIRLHDYDDLYAIPGLYDHLIYDVLECRSPTVVRELLLAQTSRAGVDAAGLRVLDLGAGNGCAGAELADHGVEFLVGVDILEAARAAAERDRRSLYSAYHVWDMTALTPRQDEQLRNHRLNCLICVAALGFGDIPPRAFAAAYNRISGDGWAAFNIKEDFLGRKDSSGFARLIRRLIDGGQLEVLDQQRYPHRLSTDQTPIHYVAIVGRKRGDIDMRLPEPA